MLARQILAGLFLTACLASISGPPAERRQRSATGMDAQRKPNRLMQETSPYLRQHALNPVDWYPWGSEALERARREDRPIFLSIGYSACHWCHVMEHESFEDPEIARLMNDLFVNIKVDREERPDLDQIYMSAVQMMTGSGGWPMSVFLTPDLKPFYGGTYFPPDDRYGRPGFKKILTAVAESYRMRRGEVEESAEAITERIRNLSGVGRSDSLLAPALLDGAARKLAASFDPTNGGFGGAPKFPQATALQLLMRHYRRTGAIESLSMVRLSLDRMAAGGIYDQVGGGFHRYSVDERWSIPHFEKMLYDNALLTLAYLEGYQLTGDPEYARIARETLGFLIREMMAPEGGFYATQDADSEGKEGVFYTWTPQELRDAIENPDDADLFARAYDVDEVGNFEGRTVLHRIKSDAELASIFRIGEAEIRGRLDAARARLHTAREERVRPHRDEKVLADWNALAISAFARASRVLDVPDFLATAEKTASLVITQLRDGQGNLLHVWKDGEARIPAFLDDYAALLVAATDLYEAGGDPRWLDEATALEQSMIRDFRDEERSGFYDTSPRHEHLIARTRHADDGATPSGNALAAYGMLRLARITGRAEGLEKAERTLKAFAPMMEAIPSGTSGMLLALDLFLAPPQEVAVVGPAEDPTARAMRRVVDRLFLPHTVLLLSEGRDGATLLGLAGKGLVGGQPAAYVCSNFACRAPVTTPEALEDALGK